MAKIVLFAVVFVTVICSGICLECYVCDNQEDNSGKCVRTVQLCAEFDDTCLSVVKWGSMPYWTRGAPKQYFISKMCSTKDLCEQSRKDRLPRCERIGYNDWECSECCQGDRCNYFVTLGSSSVRGSWLITTLAVAFAGTLAWLWK